MNGWSGGAGGLGVGYRLHRTRFSQHSGDRFSPGASAQLPHGLQYYPILRVLQEEFGCKIPSCCSSCWEFGRAVVDLPPTKTRCACSKKNSVAASVGHTPAQGLPAPGRRAGGKERLS